MATKTETKTKKIELFEGDVNEHLLYLASVLQESNARAGTAHTKTRREVRGGGRKPWKQKGTGRARAGSSTSPLWKGGGVIFGPRAVNTPKGVNWKKQMNKKEKVLALLSALRFAYQNSALQTIKEVAVKEGKSKEIVAQVASLGFVPADQVLFVIAADSANGNLVTRAAANVVNVKVIDNNSLNVKDLLKADKIVIEDAALKAIEERFAK